MKHVILLTVITFCLLTVGCSGGGQDYDSAKCLTLAEKIETDGDLTSDDYTEMIDQNEAILQYLVEKSREISEMPDSTRVGAWRALTAEPEYLERFGYMFTLGSALYDAERNGTLSRRNANRLKALDKYNEALASYCERF